MIYRSLWPALALTCLSACSNSEPLDSGTDAEVKAYFANDKTSSHLEITSTWRASANPSSIVCGRMASKGDGSSFRFVYDPTGKHGQVELPAITAGDTIAADRLIAQNREMFDSLWNDGCADYAPAFAS